MDTFTKKQRSQIMSRVKSWDTPAEIKLRKALWKKGYRYRTHCKLPGKPDIVFPRYKVAVFVDGCFWHGCPKCKKRPSSNKKYWQSKFERNKKRDMKANRELKRIGWSVVRLWEHDVNRRLMSSVSKVTSKLKN